MFCKLKENYILYVSKHKSSREKQVIIFVIPNGEGWHYITVKKLPALLRGKTLKQRRGFNCPNLHFFGTKKNANLKKKYVKTKTILTL